jgi:hypothetical protein
MTRALLGMVALFAGLLLLSGAVQAENKKLETKVLFQGSIDDEKLLAKAPPTGVITTQKGFDDLFTAWKLGDKKPEIDFKKDLVVVSTTVGSKLNLAVVLNTDKGDLQVLGLATRDLRPGFRYVIGVAPSEGVKTVNGKELPKE